MKDVFISSGEIITSLGFSTEENFSAIRNNQTGIGTVNDPVFAPVPFFASRILTLEINKKFDLLPSSFTFTRLEKLFILSITASLQNTDIDLKSQDTLLIITTTKGNIDVLENQNQNLFQPERAYLGELSGMLQRHFHAIHKPLIVCNACISGVSGIITASRLIRMGKYKNVVVSGGDIVSPFTVAGFLSFKAIGSGPCKPYDINRDGLSLGEGVATVVLSSEKNNTGQEVKIIIQGGSTTNDANHISGPSRTGDGLFAAIENAMKESGITADFIDYVSAHGTATPYNDEMECQAINSAALQNAPVNSYKGSLGHTLGAAGIIESVLTIESLKRDTLLPTTGYEKSGVSQSINVIDSAQEKKLTNALKTASGFGGCNAAVIFSKVSEK